MKRITSLVDERARRMHKSGKVDKLIDLLDEVGSHNGVLVSAYPQRDWLRRQSKSVAQIEEDIRRHEAARDIAAAHARAIYDTLLPYQRDKLRQSRRCVRAWLKEATGIEL